MKNIMKKKIMRKGLQAMFGIALLAAVGATGCSSSIIPKPVSTTKMVKIIDLFPDIKGWVERPDGLTENGVVYAVGSSYKFTDVSGARDDAKFAAVIAISEVLCARIQYSYEVNGASKPTKVSKILDPIMATGTFKRMVCDINVLGISIVDRDTYGIVKDGEAIGYQGFALAKLDLKTANKTIQEMLDSLLGKAGVSAANATDEIKTYRDGLISSGIIPDIPNPLSLPRVKLSNR